jgi:HEAT repeat protein
MKIADENDPWFDTDPGKSAKKLQRHKATEEELLRALDSDAWQVRLQAARHWSATKAVRRKAFNDHKDKESWQVRIGALEHLRHPEQAKPDEYDTEELLFEAAQDSDWRVVRAAIHHRCATEDVLECAIRSALKWTVTSRVIDALQDALESAAATDKIVYQIAHCDPAFTFQERVISRTLVRHHNASTAYLVQMLGHYDYGIRADAVMQLARLFFTNLYDNKKLSCGAYNKPKPKQTNGTRNRKKTGDSPKDCSHTPHCGCRQHRGCPSGRLGGCREKG